MSTVPALLLRCEPWLVAVPLSAVRRIVDDDGVGLVAGGTGGAAWLGQIAAGDERLPAWDLGRLLGLDASPGSWLLIDRPLPAALRTGRCLRVLHLPTAGLRPLPTIVGGPPGTLAFAVTEGFGLLIDLPALLRHATAGAAA